MRSIIISAFKYFNNILWEVAGNQNLSQKEHRTNNQRSKRKKILKSLF